MAGAVKLGTLLRVCAGLCGIVLLTASPAAAQESLSFHGKSVRMIVGSAAGGVTDQSARLVGRFIGKYLPGNPAIVVENVPGASGVKALNYFAQQVAADGLTFIAGSSSNVTPDVLRKDPAVLYDPSKFEFIGGIANPGSIVVINRAALPRLHDPAAPAVAMAQVGGTRAAAQAALWGDEYLGWNVKWVSGYEGTAEFTLALLRGEADMIDTASAEVLANSCSGIAGSGAGPNGRVQGRPDASPRFRAGCRSSIRHPRAAPFRCGAGGLRELVADDRSSASSLRCRRARRRPR